MDSRTDVEASCALQKNGLETLVELLTLRGEQAPERGYTFLLDGERDEAFLSFATLHRQASAIAAQLQWLELRGERVLLLFPPGLEFISAFFGCLYAGAIAVPAYPPDPMRLDRTLPRLQAIAADAQARAVLTTGSILELADQLLSQAPELAELRWLAVDEPDLSLESAWRPPALSRESLAFLQYTSGSTGTPKGVMVSHGNLLHNSAEIQRMAELGPESVGISWLPSYHDMGLIGGIMQPLFAGFHVVHMSPLSFLQKPARWLWAMSRYRGTNSPTPNFALDLCVRKVTDAQCAGLDLSAWRVAWNGAEPVRAESLERFAARFGAYGFRADAMSPAYGLAEGTLMVTYGHAVQPGMQVTVDRHALQQDRRVEVDSSHPGAQRLVGTGRGLEGQEIAIVDPTTGHRCAPDRVGEIWLRGPSVAQGYWNRPEETGQTFQAYIAGTGEGPFLRTGDLGFLREGILFVTGRLKDLIIIRGRNHYPQDLELAVERCHPQLRPGCCAAFSIETQGEERLVIAAEVDERGGPAEVERIVSAIRQTIAGEFDLSVHAVVLLRAGTLPKTSSGKLQRRQCRAEYLEGRLEPVWHWTAPADLPLEPSTERSPVPVSESFTGSGDRIETALRWFSERLNAIAATSGLPFDPECPFTTWGLDSMRLVELSGELADRLGSSLPATFLFDHPTLAAVSRTLRAPQAMADLSARSSSAWDEPIAIIGMACRWPGGATTPEDYWRLLEEGRDAIEPFPSQRWDVDALFDPDPAASGKTYCRHGGFLQGLDRFDAAFFGIAPREAVAMEPQQRLLLETVWEALENAGILPSRLAQSRGGVYVGTTGSDYRAASSDPALLRSLDGYAVTGQSPSVLAGRVAYTLNLRGPALTLDTACSSSLVALHLACQALRAGECDLAVTAGTTVMNTPATFVDFSRLRALAPDGHCKSFGAGADGVAWAEGCGVLLLKRLSDAKRSGERILAVVRGTAVNQDGKSQGLTAPNGPAQEEVIRQALMRSGLRADDLDAVEAHGTGTPLGDPIEAHALAAVFGRGRSSDRPLRLGSCKSNIGHTQAAAGIAGVMKLVLALQHELLPRTLHAEEPSPHVKWAGSGLALLREAHPWPRGSRPRRAGVSSFGMSGTNAHVILEEAPVETPAGNRGTAPGDGVDGGSPAAVALPISGHTLEALRANAEKLRAHLAAHPDLDPVDVANTLAARTHFKHRAVVVGRERASILDALTAVSQGTPHPAVIEGKAGKPGRVVFVFPGQGSQWEGMARTLLESSPVFRDRLLACERALSPFVDWSLLAVLRGEESAPSLERVDVVQPVLFAVMVSLAALWRSAGLEPDAVVGHSQGELAAACVAGALSLEDAAMVVALRSRALVRLEGRGAMAVVELPVDEVERRLVPFDPRLSVAAINSATSTLISGEPEALARMLEQLTAEQVFARRIQVTYASHCAQVEAIREELLERTGSIRPRVASTPFYSTVSPGRLEGPELDAGYWYRNLRQPVRFVDAVSALLAEDHRFFVEASPHPVLTLALQTQLESAGQAGAVVGTLRREEGGWERLLLSLGTLYAWGLELEWRRLLPPGRRVDLPTYAFQRESFWLREETSRTRRESAGGHPLLGPVQTLSTQPGTRFWDAPLSVEKQPWLDDHIVRGAVVFPGAGYAEMALSAGRQCFGDEPFEVAGLTLLQALSLRRDETVEVQTVLTEDGTGHRRLQVASRPADSFGPWTTHAQAVLRKVTGSPSHLPAAVEAIHKRREDPGGGENPYARLREIGLELGAAFQGIEALWRSRGEAIARIRFPEAAGAPDAYQIHPALLDACFQVLAGAMLDHDDAHLWIPVGIERLHLHRRPGRALWCHARIVTGKAIPENRRWTDLVVTDQAGAVVLEVEGLVVQRIVKTIARRDDEGTFLSLSWIPVAVPAPKLQAGAWLLVGGNGGQAEELRLELEAAGHRVVKASAGQSQDASAIRAVLETAFGGAAPTGIVLLSSLEAQEDAEALSQALVLACGSVLHTVRTVAGTTFREPPRLWLVTRGAQAAGAGPVSCHQAVLLGLGRAIAMEHAELRCARLDLDPARPPGEVAAVVAELLADDAEDEVAHRGGQRLTARLVRSEDERIQQVPPTIRHDASYLITGGLGGLGLSVAGWLASEGAGHLVLIGRSGATNEAQRSALAALEAQGTSVTLAALDVADRIALSDLLETLPADRPLRGVVHAAGVLDDGMLLQQTPERFRTVLTPKAVGAWNLHVLTRMHDLDFFVLYSSLAGLLGSPGQGNYAAASTFLDALAHQRRAEGLPGLSIDWGPFSEVGLAAAHDSRGARLSARGLRSLTPAQGLTALSRALRQQHAQVAVALLDARQWVESFPTAAASKLLSQLAAESPGRERATRDQALLDRIAAAQPAERASILEEAVVQMASRVLRLAPEKLDRDTPLTSLGVDSLTGLELRNRLEAALGLTIASTLLWTYPTITELSRHLLTRLSGEGGNAAAPQPSMKPPVVEAPPSGDALTEDDILSLLQAELDLKRNRK